MTVTDLAITRFRIPYISKLLYARFTMTSVPSDSYPDTRDAPLLEKCPCSGIVNRAWLLGIPFRVSVGSIP